MGVAVLALLGMSACSSSDAEPEAVRTTTATSATPTPTPSPTGQPQGVGGVTYEFQNWSKYSTDPVVLAWKQTYEAFSASIRSGTLQPDLRSGMSKAVLREATPGIKLAWDKGWQIKDVAQVKAQSSRTSGSTARLVMCIWSPSVAYFTASGDPVSELKKVWHKQNVKLERKGQQWIVTSAKTDGTCSGGQPA